LDRLDDRVLLGNGQAALEPVGDIGGETDLGAQGKSGSSTLTK
jgi:hypothetical protein